MIVPAVTDVCLPQPAHSHVHGLVCSCHAFLLPQSGQTKPSGQRAMKRYLTQAASSGKRCWNSIRERGKSVTASHPKRSMFVLCSIPEAILSLTYPNMTLYISCQGDIRCHTLSSTN